MALPMALLAACGTVAAPAAQTGPARPARKAASPAAGHTAGAAAAVSAGPASNQADGRSAAATPTASGAPTSSATPTAPAAPAAPAAAQGTRVPGAPGCPMFPANNVWNTDISKLPVDSHNAAWLRSMAAGRTYLHPDFGPDQGGDRHAIMVNMSTCKLYELWDARYSATRPTAGSGAIWNLRSNALRPAGWTSADAAGLPILPGLLNYSRVAAAVRSGKPITHAIRFTAQTTRTAYIWPARHEAGSSSRSSLPPMGARFRLKASLSVARFCRNSARYCKDAKAVLTEMQHYGLILADNGSNWFFQGSAFPQWPDGLVSLLKGIPARDFQAVNESCLMVSRSSGAVTAKPGCPIG